MWTKFNGVEGQVFPPAMASYVAVKLYGPGHVVAYNYIADFHDGINVETYGNPDGSVAQGPASSTGRSIRRASTGIAGRSPSTSTTTTSPTRTTTRSRPTAACTTSASCGTCSSTMRRTRSAISRRSAARSTGSATSPITCPADRLGSPTASAGVLFYNNTILSETAAAAASNMPLAQQPDARRERRCQRSSAVTTLTNYTSSDYNGFRPNPGAAVVVRWNSPPAGPRADFTGPGHTARARDAAVSRRWPSTAGNRAGPHTACSWTTTSSSTSRSWTRRTPPPCRRLYKREDLDFQLRSRLGGHRSRPDAADGDRRLRGTCAGPWRAGIRSATAGLRSAPLNEPLLL